tara:strand:- start:482 stop:931 length:450 start_codon:yes stop_codon:yes gene_type:complete
MSKALIAAGCFWGIEEHYRKINGVLNTKVGYTGGHFDNPTYEDVCSGNTGHAEAVLIDFDDLKLTYEEILNLFWSCHDPTQLNRQGYDIGSQYRSAIYYYSEKQKQIAANSKDTFQNKFNNSIVTEITKATEFFLAEDYHQCFIQKKNY